MKENHLVLVVKMTIRRKKNLKLFRIDEVPFAKYLLN